MTSGPMFWVLYIVLLGGMLYFMAIRPQKKEKQRQKELLESVAVGDTILTSSGFYGVIIDMTDDTVIVEFGNNKNCRIPGALSRVFEYGEMFPLEAAKPSYMKESRRIG